MKIESESSKSSGKFSTGIIVGIILGIAITILFIILILVLNRVADNISNPDNTTISLPGTKTNISQISKGKVCSFEGRCMFDAAIFLGPINNNSAQLLIGFLNKNTNLKTVCFSSYGGDVDAATEISSYIIKNNLTTCMADYYQLSDYKNEIVSLSKCSSSCNQVLLSAKKRILIGSNTDFNGHAYAFGSFNEFKILNLKLTYQYSSVKAPNQFFEAIELANTADKKQHIEYVNLIKGISHFDKIKNLTRDELIKYKIFTDTCQKECFKYGSTL